MSSTSSQAGPHSPLAAGTAAVNVFSESLTGSGRQLVGSQLPARPSIQERVDELTVILAEAGLIPDVVEFTWAFT